VVLGLSKKLNHDSLRCGQKAEARIYVLLLCLPFLAVIPGAYELMFLRLSSNIVPIWLVTGIVLMIFGHTWARRRISVLRHKLQAGDYLFCPGCGYYLGVCEESGTCPECGRLYSFSKLPKDWGAHSGFGKHTV